MATIITRETGATAKGSPLTNLELDNNFINLNTELGQKLPLAGGTMTGVITFAAGQTWPTFNKTDSQGLIVITDGEFYTPQVTVKKPVYWCVFNNKKFTAPFGKVVHLDL
jgi:hypothetical protein